MSKLMRTCSGRRGCRPEAAHGDLAGHTTLEPADSRHRPDEVYNLGAQSHVRISFDMPEFTADVVGLGTLRLLDRDSETTTSPPAFYQASSSEMYGATEARVQDENTPFHPRSPYACAKVFAHHMSINYREAYGCTSPAASSSTTNHPVAVKNFVTRKITRGLAAILAGETEELVLGNLDAARRLGICRRLRRSHVADAAAGVRRRLRHRNGRDAHDSRFPRRELRLVGMDWQTVVKQDQRFTRPTEVDRLAATLRRPRGCSAGSRKPPSMGWCG